MLNVVDGRDTTHGLDLVFTWRLQGGADLAQCWRGVQHLLNQINKGRP
jgi:hypothetical protein